MNTTVAPQMKIPTVILPKRPRDCEENEARCVVCSKPVNVEKHAKFLWAHCGGGVAVTREEGERLNQTEEGRLGDLGMQPIGSCCLKNHTELKPYVMGR